MTGCSPPRGYPPSISAAISGLALRNSRALSCPGRSSRPCRHTRHRTCRPVCGRRPFDDFTLRGNALAVQDVEDGFAEGGDTLFLTTLTLVSLPITSSPFLIEPMRRMSRRTGVELQRVAAGGGFRRAEHDADLHADLVDEDDQVLVFLILAVSCAGLGSSGGRAGRPSGRPFRLRFRRAGSGRRPSRRR